jgi:sarcosine oxidase subunit alpha
MAETMVPIQVNGRPLNVPVGTSAAAAVAMAGGWTLRRSVTGQPRGPVCGMGICFECRLTIDGEPHRRSCQTPCVPGMEIRSNES